MQGAVLQAIRTTHRGMTLPHGICETSVIRSRLLSYAGQGYHCRAPPRTIVESILSARSGVGEPRAAQGLPFDRASVRHSARAVGGSPDRVKLPQESSVAEDWGRPR